MQRSEGKDGNCQQPSTEIRFDEPVSAKTNGGADVQRSREVENGGLSKWVCISERTKQGGCEDY